MLNTSNLKAERARKGLTMEQLAKELDLTRSAIHRYENGVSQPTIKILVKMSEIFEVSTDYLLGKV